MKKIFITSILLTIIFFTCLPSFVSAEYEIEVSIPGGPTAETPVGLAEYIKYIYIFGLSLIGIAALGVLVYGGLMYMLSDTVVSKDDAKKYIWAAISGLLLGLAAFLILNTINPDLTYLTLPNLPDLPELEGPKPLTDCTEDASVCTGCEYCDKISAEKSVCKNKCTSECAPCVGSACVKKTDGELCSGGVCKGGACQPIDPDCTLTGGCMDHGNCCSGLCYLQLCTEITPPEPPCVTGGCVVGGTPCCSPNTCQQMECK